MDKVIDSFTHIKTVCIWLNINKVVSIEPVPVLNVTALKSRYLGPQRNCLKKPVPVPNVTALKSR